MVDQSEPSAILGRLLTLELYSHQGVERADDGRVQAWCDTRDGGFAARQSRADRRPSWVAGALRQWPAVRFTSANAAVELCFLDIAHDDALNPDDGDFRILLVGRNRSMATTDPLNKFLRKGDAYAIYLERLGDASMGTKFLARDRGRDRALRTHAETTATNIGAVHLYELALDGDQLRAAIDGDFSRGFSGVDDTYAGTVANADPLRLGGINAGVDLFAVLVIKGEATAQQLDDVRTYLIEQYDIPSTPPAVVPASDEQTAVISVNTGGRARIPAVVRCDDDSLVIFAEHRWNGDADAGHIGTVARRSTDGGISWGPQFFVADDGVNTLGNPVPIVDRSTGRLHLLLTGNRATDTEKEINEGTSEDTRRVYRTFSDDHGVTWAPVAEITSSVKDPAWRWYATGPGGAEQLAGGRLLVPCNHFDPALSTWRAHVIYSDDHGETWRIGGLIETDRTNEIQTAQLPDGTLVAHIRWNIDNNPPGFKYWATSTDEGLTWTPATRNYSLPSTPVQDDILVLPDGRLVATNHQDFTGRYNLAINVSPDVGRTWPAYTIIRVGAVGNGAAYSDLVHVAGHRILAIWEAGREISVRLFDVVEVEDGES
ncbi:sialidase family protein [Kineosporia succinea]|uniref:exo-alpha-sialidase n=1 Tax=Kineosporia succinea TaxID=84632 RepID=A0ABT9NXI5_9ACTN|nr:sialidase family protein [Kineosporia succinea]MDP9824987.1 hypothetical protein [Kineosporia succinea]